MTLSPDQIQIIKATVPVLQQHGNTITAVFYENMLNAHPELNSVFNTSSQVNGHQPRALASALFAYASNIDDLGVLGPAVELICNKHASLCIKPDHYTIVGQYLLEAMKQVLGDALTPAIHEAWAKAYWQLADIMIGRETELYKKSNCWTEFREFRVDKKIPESTEITSFYLKPIDEKPLPKFLPGQYISVQVNVPDLKYHQARQYSLSDMPRSDYYRISVKKESGLIPPNLDSKANPGYVSNILHDSIKEGDIIRVTHPYGDFFLSDTDSTHPVVLIAAGVGLTPLTSILNTLTSASASAVQRKISFIHGARTSKARAFKTHVKSLEHRLPNLHTTFFTSNPSAEDQKEVDYNHVGRVDLGVVDANNDLYLDDSTTEYYVCGPEQFMVDMATFLKSRGVSHTRVKVELFGTGGVPLV